MTEAIETREIQFRIDNADERTVVGMAVPYEVEAHGERFQRNAVELHRDAKLYWNHKDVIGVIERGEHTADGYMIRARFAKGTQSADEAYALAQQGIVDKFSVGFIMDEARQDGKTRVVTRAIVKEVSLTPMPWYETADVLGVRNAEENTDPEVPDSAPNKEEKVEEITPTDSGLAEVRESIQMLERELAGINKVEAEAPSYRSAGEFLKALVSGDQAAERAYTGATTAESVVTPVDFDLIRLVEGANPLGSVFGRGVTPAEGMTITFAQVDSQTDGTATQANEGDDLGYYELNIGTSTENIITVGNYAELSRQAIDRSTVPYLDSVLRGQAIALGKELADQLRTKYQAVCASQVTAGNKVTLATTDYAGWVGGLADASANYFTPNGVQIDALIVDKATFKDLLALDGTPVISFSGEAVGTVGSANPGALRGSIAGIPIIVDAGLDSVNKDECAFVSSLALRQYTSGALRLSQENAVNLSEAFSISTYTAVADEYPAFIIPIDQTA